MPYHDIIVYGRKLAADQLLFLVLLTPSNELGLICRCRMPAVYLDLPRKKKEEKKKIFKHTWTQAHK